MKSIDSHWLCDVSIKELLQPFFSVYDHICSLRWHICRANIITLEKSLGQQGFAYTIGTLIGSIAIYAASLCIANTL